MEKIFAENPAYLIIAFSATFLYVVKMVMFFVSGDGDTDLLDGDVDGSHFDGGDNFSLVSTQSILAFLMGVGWIGLAAKREWELSDMHALLAAVGFGFLMMLLSSFLTFKIKKLNYIPKSNPKEAIGKTGRSYTNIPAKGQGVGQVEIALAGKQQILQATSNGKAIKSFNNIKVVDISDTGHLIVERA